MQEAAKIQLIITGDMAGGVSNLVSLDLVKKVDNLLLSPLVA